MPLTFLAWGVGCFAKGTPVATPKGKVAIETLNAGDHLLSFDGEKIIETTVDFMIGVSNKPKPMIQFMYDESTTPIRATYDHPFFDGERYYPLYQLVWRDLEASQRLQLQLLCEQYGQTLDNKTSRGLSHSDNETGQRPVWTPEDSNERKNDKGSSSNRSNLATKSEQTTFDKSPRLQPSEQQYRKPGMGNVEQEQPTRLQIRKTIGISKGSSKSSQADFYGGAVPPNMGYSTECFKERVGKNSNVRRITSFISSSEKTDYCKSPTSSTRLHSIQVLEAETYYAVGVNDIHTYIVGDGLPVHNTGKTKEALDRANAVGATNLLIFAPTVLKSMKHWEREANKWGNHTPMQVETYYRLQQYGRADADHKLPNKGKGYAIIIDECQKVKSSQSQQGLGAFKLIRDNPDAHVYLLSGTPASNGYQDFTNYAKMTGFVKNKTDFWKRYIITSNYRGFPEIATYINTAELDDWWARIADIKPPQIFTSEHDITVDFPSVANEVLAKKTRVGVLDGEKYMLENASQLTHYCRQAACLTKVRMDWLEQFLDSTEDNVVVFVGYKRAMADVLAVAGKLGKKVYQVDGDVKSLPADAEAAGLKNAVIAVNYQSGGAGLNLQYANHAVFYSPTYSYADYIQARGRISRRGQEKKCTFYHLQADKSIERDIYEALKIKEDFSIKLWTAKYKDDGEGDESVLLS